MHTGAVASSTSVDGSSVTSQARELTSVAGPTANGQCAINSSRGNTMNTVCWNIGSVKSN